MARSGSPWGQDLHVSTRRDDGLPGSPEPRQRSIEAPAVLGLWPALGGAPPNTKQSLTRCTPTGWLPWGGVKPAFGEEHRMGPQKNTCGCRKGQTRNANSELSLRARLARDGKVEVPTTTTPRTLQGRQVKAPKGCLREVPGTAPFGGLCRV